MTLMIPATALNDVCTAHSLPVGCDTRQPAIDIRDANRCWIVRYQLNAVSQGHYIQCCQK